MPFGVSIYRTGCSNFIAFVLKIGLGYGKASFNNNDDKHAVVKNRTHLPVPVQVDSLRVTLDSRRSNSKIELLCFHSHPNPTQCLGSLLWHCEELTEPPCKKKKTKIRLLTVSFPEAVPWCLYQYLLSGAGESQDCFTCCSPEIFSKEIQHWGRQSQVHCPGPFLTNDVSI